MADENDDMNNGTGTDDNAEGSDDTGKEGAEGSTEEDTGM